MTEKGTCSQAQSWQDELDLNNPEEKRSALNGVCC
jgi:hypothetical protein